MVVKIPQVVWQPFNIFYELFYEQIQNLFPKICHYLKVGDPHHSLRLGGPAQSKSVAVNKLGCLSYSDRSVSFLVYKTGIDMFVVIHQCQYVLELLCLLQIQPESCSPITVLMTRHITMNQQLHMKCPFKMYSKNLKELIFIILFKLIL